MSENSNRNLVQNSLILYFRLGIVCICSLLSTRFAFQSLGVINFGLFAVVGSIISFISIANTMMISSSNRFIATAIGKGDVNLANKQFNTNLMIHIGIAAITAIIAIPIGDWYILRHVNYDGNIYDAISVFRITIGASIFSFLGVPFNGLLLAKERFFVFCSTDVISNIIKLTICWLLTFAFDDKLFVYAWMTAITTGFPAIVFFIYCKRKFDEITRFKIVKDWNSYRDVLNFTTWVGYGTLAFVGRTQFAAMLVNGFFNTIMNTALGISNSMKNLIETFSTNITKPIEPQITKSFAAGNIGRSEHLLAISIKFSFMMTLTMLVPFFIETEFIIKTWLGDIPDYSVLFTRLSLVICLVDSLSSGISDFVFATGKIKTYQLCVSTILLLSIPVGYIFLKMGFPAYSLLIIYIIFSAIAFISRQLIIHYCHKIDNRILLKKAYLPAITVLLVSIPTFFIKKFFCLPSLINIAIVLLYLTSSTFFIGLDKNERLAIINYLTKKSCK